MTDHVPSTVIIGLGNPILTDDAVGWRVVERVRQMVHEDERLSGRGAPDFAVACVGGLSLAELMVGYQRAIVVDAVLEAEHQPGTVMHFDPTELPGTLNSASAHDTNVNTALHMLRVYGAQVPPDDAIDFVAVVAEDVWTFGEKCTASVEKSIPQAAALICKILAGS